MPCWVLEVELDPEALVVGVDEAEGVASRSRACGGSVAGMPRSLMTMVTWCSASGSERPEVPVVLGAAQVGARVALDGVVQVGELQRVAEEEHRRVVADQVPVAFLGVELHAKPRMSRSASAAPRSPATVEKRANSSVFLPTSEKIFARGVPGDVVRDGEGAVRAGALGVHAALGDHLAVEVRQLSRGTRRPAAAPGRAARRSDVLIVRHRRSGSMCQRWSFGSLVIGIVLRS